MDSYYFILSTAFYNAGVPNIWLQNGNDFETSYIKMHLNHIIYYVSKTGIAQFIRTASVTFIGC